jgi:phospholipid transport system substrate-binding protein
MRRLAPLIAASALLLAVAAPAEKPRDFVQEMADEVLAVLKKQDLGPDAKVEAIEEIAYARFDFETISRLVLARNWRKMSPPQQEKFIQEFKKHLSVTYGKNVDDYANEVVQITGDREEPRGDWTVQTKIVRGRSAEDIFIDYRLRAKDGQWRVIDVVVERISLISNFRSQLQEIASRDGIDAMLAMLEEKNASGESILPNEQREPG